MTPDTAPDATPRPWSIDDGFDNWVMIANDNNEDVASVVGMPNARLIVEAVNAYDALRLENDGLRRTVLRFERALEEIVKHQQMIAGTMNAHSTVTMIAKAALQQEGKP